MLRDKVGYLAMAGNTVEQIKDMTGPAAKLASICLLYTSFRLTVNANYDQYINGTYVENIRTTYTSGLLYIYPDGHQLRYLKRVLNKSQHPGHHATEITLYPCGRAPADVSQYRTEMP